MFRIVLAICVLFFVSVVNQAQARTKKIIVVHKYEDATATIAVPSLTYSVLPQAIAVSPPTATAPVLAPDPASAPPVTKYAAPVMRYSVAVPVRTTRPLSRSERKRMERSTTKVIVNP